MEDLLEVLWRPLGRGLRFLSWRLGQAARCAWALRPGQVARLRLTSLRRRSDLQRWAARNARQGESRVAPVSLEPRALADLAGFLTLNAALPFRRYRIAGQVETLRQMLVDDETAPRDLVAAAWLRTPDWSRERHYRLFLRDYATVFGVRADKELWPRQPIW